jgi:hypothetical protein
LEIASEIPESLCIPDGHRVGGFEPSGGDLFTRTEREREAKAVVIIEFILLFTRRSKRNPIGLLEGIKDGVGTILTELKAHFIPEFFLRFATMVNQASLRSSMFFWLSKMNVCFLTFAMV